MAKTVNGKIVVQPGDTLWGIYGPNWKQMSGYTGDPRRLQPGTVLPAPGTPQLRTPNFSTPSGPVYATPSGGNLPKSPSNIKNMAQAPSPKNPGIESIQLKFPQNQPSIPTPPPDQGGPQWQDLVPIIAKVAQESGLPPSAVIAQAALESRFGQSAPGNNLFGIKGSGTAGSQRLWTTENVGGNDVRTQDNFAAYNSLEDSVRDYVRLITQNPRYSAALNNANDPEKYIESIRQAGYATDPNYISKVKSYERQYRNFNTPISQPAPTGFTPDTSTQSAVPVPQYIQLPSFQTTPQSLMPSINNNFQVPKPNL